METTNYHVEGYIILLNAINVDTTHRARTVVAHDAMSGQSRRVKPKISI